MLVPGAQHSDSNFYYKTIATVNLVTVTTQKYYVTSDYISYSICYIPVSHLFCNWKFVPLFPSPLLPTSPPPHPLWQPPVVCTYDSVSVLSCEFIYFVF